MLRASLSVGPVDAYLEASLDAMINFYPVHYRADIRVSVGVEFSLDILFIHIQYTRPCTAVKKQLTFHSVSCHVGADLHIEGPEFGGKAQ
jgi:hypothetical protein